MRDKAIPILIFIVAQLASVTLLVLWIVWGAMANTSVWWFVEGILLMIPVIGGATIIFVYWSKTRLLDIERVNFISSVSHELLTPLASMRLYIETMMIRELDEEKQRRFLELMLTDSERLASLISNILTASRIERGKVPYRFQQADLAQLTKKFVGENVLRLEAVKLEMDLEENCDCMVDEESYNMILKNLLENAIRYSTAPAAVAITLKKDDAKLQLTISDAGDGIAHRDLKKIFKVFYRAAESQGGTGLGLYIVRQVVKAHRGKVWAESRGRGKGTSVHILLPAANGE